MFYFPIVTRRWQRTLLWSLLIILTVVTVVCVFCVIFKCRPISYTWTQIIGKGHGKCLPNSVSIGVGYTQTGLSVVADVILGLLPIHLLKDVNMDRRTKISTIILLSLGSLYVSDFNHLGALPLTLQQYQYLGCDSASTLPKDCQHILLYVQRTHWTPFPLLGHKLISPQGKQFYSSAHRSNQASASSAADWLSVAHSYEWLEGVAL